NLAALANCNNGMYMPNVQPINTTVPQTFVTPMGNVTYPTIGNSFFRPVGSVGGIDALSAIGFGQTIPTNFAGITTGVGAPGIQTGAAIRVSPFQTVIPTNGTIPGTTWNAGMTSIPVN